LFYARKAELPTQAHKIAFKELARLKRMGPFSPEHGVIRNYVELISELPWSSCSPETIDIAKAKKVKRFYTRRFRQT
jgi:ATP-dependent Lon protease